MMYLGIDLGTSSVKAILLSDTDGQGDSERGGILAEASAPLSVSRPQPLWSEQDPDTWWAATKEAVHAVAAKTSNGLRGLRGIGLSGQMHGATLLGSDDRPLRPAILWNDGRSARECRELEERAPELREITGNIAMPGFTAPKLLWTRNHEPEVFERVRCVLLPKDYVRLCLSGDHATDLSDASGTLWVDVARRRWSEPLLEACGLGLDAMPSLYEGPEITGLLRQEVALEWGCDPVPIVAGAGDNAAGAIGTGVVEPGRAFLSLGTSGVYFVAGDAFQPNTAQAVHAFCHALPDRWHQMSVLLSAASCLSWIAGVTGARDEATLLDEIARSGTTSERLLFLPYLSGERTPHNDPHATGVFVGLDHDCDRAALGRAVLEGVAFAFADAEAVLLEAGSRIDEVTVIGGGARSTLWGPILASVLDRSLVYRRGAEVGPALGAARLAWLGVSGASVTDVCTQGSIESVAEPNAALVERYAVAHQRFRALYPALREAFRSHASSTEENRP